MNTLFPRASLKRSPRTRPRKDTLSLHLDAGCPPSRTSSVTRPKTRPPPLQMIPELSENELDISHQQSPMTARSTASVPIEQKLDSTRFTLSAYTFSIDDALVMFSDRPPSSPALSVSSSTSGSEDIPSTPGASDDDEYDLRLPTPCLRPQRISIRPLCITKSRSFLCHDEEDIQELLSKDEGKAVTSPVGEEQLENHPEATEVADEAEEDFYAREFQDFISLYSTLPTPSSPARRDSITIAVHPLPTIVEVPESKPAGRSRHSKPLPSLPPVTPLLAAFPSIPTFPLVQTTAQKSIVRRKRNMPTVPNYPPPPPPVESRPLPRMAVPEDVDIFDLSEEVVDFRPRESIVIRPMYDEDEDEDASIYSQPSFASISRRSTHPLRPAIPETPLTGMYGDFCLPRSSIDSEAPRSSIESASSFASTSSSSSHVPISPFSFPSTPRSASSDDHESIHRLRSRWSASTLASLAAEQPRSTLLSPLRTVFGSRVRRAPSVPSATATPSHGAPPRNPLHPHLRTPSKLPAQKSTFPVTPSPPSTPVRHVRKRSSRSSISSMGSCSEHDNLDGPSGGLKRKPIPVSMFLRA